MNKSSLGSNVWTFIICKDLFRETYKEPGQAVQAKRNQWDYSEINKNSIGMVSERDNAGI